MLNAIWYACEGKTKEALTSALCALPGLGMGIGSLMEKTSKFAQAGKTVKYLSRMTQGGMGVVAGISMAKAGLTNILNGLESGNLNGWDVVTFIGGIAITGLSGRNLAISGRGLAGMMDDAGKVAKAGKAEKVESEGGSGSALDNANYAQKTYSNTFSPEGIKKYSDLAGEPINTVDDLVNAINNGKISVNDLPIEYIVRDGNTLILNTRTSQALTQAGIPRNQWRSVNRTGNRLFEQLLDGQLSRNKLTSEGISTVRLGGKK